MSIMNILFMGEERAMIRRATVTEWERRHPPGQGVTVAEHKFPHVDPNWDNNNPAYQANMRDLRNLIIQRMKE